MAQLDPSAPAGGDALLRHLAGIVSAQQSEITQLRHEVAELRSVWRSSHADLANTISVASTSADDRCESLQKELSKASLAIRSLELSALEAEQLAAQKMASLERQTSHQIDINAQRVADAVFLQERLNTLMNQKTTSPVARADEPTSAAVGEVALRLTRLQRQFDDLLAVFEIPNTYTSSEGRPVTTQSLEIVAAQPRAKRVRFLHALPCFHVLWAELFRVAQQQRVPYVTSSRRVTRDDAEEDKSLPSPSRAAVETSRFHPSGIVAVPGLGVDIVAMEGQRGVVLFRLVRGGALEGAGCVEGDTIVAVGDVGISGCFHFADLIEEAQRVRSTRLLLSVIPVGRSTAMPVSIRVAFQ